MDMYQYAEAKLLNKVIRAAGKSAKPERPGELCPAV